MSLSILAISLDGTVLSVALPTLAESLGASDTYLEWFAAGYLLTLAAAVLPAGLLGDRFGRKRLLLISLAIFGAGSTLCAYAETPSMFLAARLLMGVAGAGVTVMALSALTVLFTEEERPKAVGVYSAANFLALPLGPLLGGWLLSHFWWGWVFLLNVPVVIIGLLVVSRLVPESRSGQGTPIDLIGILLSAGGLVLVTYGLVDAGAHGWLHATVLATSGVGLVLLAAFFVWERRLARQGGHPLVDPGLFSSRSYTWGAILSGVAGLGMIGVLFLMPQFFQAVQGTDTFGSGIRMLPLVAGMIIGAVTAGRLASAIGAKLTVALGYLLIVVGTVLGTATSTGSSFAFIGLWMTVLCAGAGMALTAATAAALSRLTVERSGVGSAVVQAFQKISAPLGTAIMGSVAAAAYRRDLDLDGLPAGAAEAARSSVHGGVEVARQLGSVRLEEQVRVAYTHGITLSLAVAAGLAVAGLLLTVIFLPRSAASARAAAGRQPGVPVKPAPVPDR
ncbi:DHA2 family efflux MFS transporter permease subunit [Phytohabitans suffuscus]|uniref:MFS transporter n=1 Tax=Phytohabitans suffuscus TaxID=624315 RepID=A0A6F8YEJ9_9ACTN|nr:DHA2 family efflux MFS transporter permease subunit [Phytohabitans suffuscus]BCB84564.1 MFS transporter [Phytohabitans suffuscus]